MAPTHTICAHQFIFVARLLQPPTNPNVLMQLLPYGDGFENTSVLL